MIDVSTLIDGRPKLVQVSQRFWSTVDVKGGVDDRAFLYAPPAAIGRPSALSYSGSLAVSC